jgi:hypothetical protein
VIQLFKFLGFTRIIAYASKTHFDYLKQLGATEFVDRVEVPVASLAAHPALSPPVKVVYDVGNAPNEAYDCVADGGSIATAVWAEKLDRNVKGKKVTLVSAMGYIAGADVMKLKRDDVVGYLGTPEHTVFGRLIIKNLPEMLKKGVVVVWIHLFFHQIVHPAGFQANRIEILPNGLVGILRGLERLQKGSVSGVKLVAHPQDPAA